MLIDGEASRGEVKRTFAWGLDCVLRKGGLVPVREMEERCVLFCYLGWIHVCLPFDTKSLWVDRSDPYSNLINLWIRCNKLAKYKLLTK